jgi:ATP-binding cassette subfamily B protein
MEKESSKKITFPIKVVFDYYWQSMRPYKWRAVLIFMAYGLATLLSNVVQPLVFRKIVDLISSGTLEKSLVQTDLWFWFWCFVGVTILYQFFYRTGDFFISFLESKVMKNLADRAFSDIHRHSYRFFSDTFSGSLVAKSKRFVASFENLFDISVYSFWMTFIGVSGMLVTLFALAPILAWILLVWVVLYVWFSWWIMRKKTPYDEALSKEDSKLTAHLSDVLSNILTVKTFAREQGEKASFAKTTAKWEETRHTSQRFRNTVFAYQTLMLGGLEVVITGIALHLWLRGDLSSGTVVMTQWYMMSLFGAMFQMNRSFGRFVQSLAEASEMIEIFETPTDVSDNKHTQKIRSIQGEVALQHLTFAYADGLPVFQDLSVRFASGEKVGIVGSSGAGKSTLTKLLLRFLDPHSGAVLLDGVDIRTLAQTDVRKMIAYVSQDATLFHRSLRDNIVYGKPDATDANIIEAAQKAHAHEFIEKMSKGYDTLVGERGVKLSGGERQRVALARAILKDAPILILDEATSSLDTVSEKLIQDALDVLMQDKTVLVIAHRLSTVRKMDRIIVLEQGTIAEEGTHDTLLAIDGAYANLWKRQTDGFIE